MKAFDNVFYDPIDAQAWTGRVDADSADYYRWHQIIEFLDLNEDIQSLENKLVLLGFCCDEGVKRNQGRVGAKEAPDTLRKILAGLPDHTNLYKRIADAGNIICVGEDMEAAQEELARRVSQIIKLGGLPLVIGGGHEVTYGNFRGVRETTPSRKVGVINFDAHLDIRETVENRGNSGTGFYQIAEEAKLNKEEFHYLAIGIQDISNTKALFKYAAENNVEIIKAKDIHTGTIDAIKNQIREFSEKVDLVYVTIDMDVFAAPFAPGVSATAFSGIIPDPNFYSIFQSVLTIQNLKSMDIAEINPIYDIDNRTTKLAADLIFRVANIS